MLIRRSEYDFYMKTTYFSTPFFTISLKNTFTSPSCVWSYPILHEFFSDFTISLLSVFSSFSFSLPTLLIISCLHCVPPAIPISQSTRVLIPIATVSPYSYIELCEKKFRTVETKVLCACFLCNQRTVDRYVLF